MLNQLRNLRLSSIFSFVLHESNESYVILDGVQDWLHVSVSEMPINSSELLHALVAFLGFFIILTDTANSFFIGKYNISVIFLIKMFKITTYTHQVFKPRLCADKSLTISYFYMNLCHFVHWLHTLHFWLLKGQIDLASQNSTSDDSCTVSQSCDIENISGSVTSQTCRNVWWRLNTSTQNTVVCSDNNATKV